MNGPWGQHLEQEGETLRFTGCMEDEEPQSSHQEGELAPGLREHLKQDGVGAAERSERSSDMVAIKRHGCPGRASRFWGWPAKGWITEH